MLTENWGEGVVASVLSHFVFRVSGTVGLFVCLFLLPRVVRTSHTSINLLFEFCSIHLLFFPLRMSDLTRSNKEQVRICAARMFPRIHVSLLMVVSVLI